MLYSYLEMNSRLSYYMSIKLYSFNETEKKFWITIGRSCRIIHAQYWSPIGNWFHAHVNEVPKRKWIIQRISFSEEFFFFYIIELFFRNFHWSVSGESEKREVRCRQTKMKNGREMNIAFCGINISLFVIKFYWTNVKTKPNLCILWTE